jgi:hypothetical protein
MAGDGINATVRGLPDLKAALMSVVPKLRKKALRDALRAGARAVQRRARQATPVLKLSTESGASALRRGVRKIGTVRKAISVRTSKLSTRQGNVGVFVNVRPAKRGQRGAKNPNDPFYWRWLNYGWNPAGGDRSRAGRRERRRLNKAGVDKRKPGARFLEAGAQALRDALAIFTREIGPRIARLNQGKNAQP